MMILKTIGMKEIFRRVTDILHCFMRTHEGMTQESLALCWLVPSLGEKRMERVTKLMNIVGLPVDLDDDDKPMASNFTFSRTADGCIEYKISGAKGKKIAKEMPNYIIDAILPGWQESLSINRQFATVELYEQYKQDLKTLYILHTNCFHMLQFRGDFNERLAGILQSKIDKFCRLHRKLFPTKYGNYFHELESGHLYEQLIKYKNLFRFNCSSQEANIGVTRNWFFRHTNKGGSGKGGKVRSIEQSMLRRMQRVAYRNVSNMTDEDIMKVAEENGKVLNAESKKNKESSS